MKKKRNLFPHQISYLLLSLLLLFHLSACSSKSKALSTETPVKLTLFVAASLNNAMSEIQKNYEKENPYITLFLNTEGSQTLQRQIEEGAFCDLFFSAATKQMDALAEQKLIYEETLTPLLENQVVLITSKTSKTQVTSFDTIPLASSIALASEEVPIGQYAREIFSSLGNLDEVMNMEINEGANVSAVLSAVSEQSNEIGVVYSTDAASMENSVRVIEIAPAKSMKQLALYPVAQVVNPKADERQLTETRRFLEYLKGPEAAEIFERFGFILHD